jgi:hypothetical protein
LIMSDNTNVQLVELHMIRTGSHDFKASVWFQGAWLIRGGKQKKTAQRTLELAIKEAGGTIPRWKIVWHQAVQPNQTPVPQVQAASVAPPVVQVALSAHKPEPSEEIVRPEVPAAKAGTVLVTPWNNPEAWKQAIGLAITEVLALGYTVDRDTSVQFRQNVNQLMESKGYFGAYRLLPNGDLAFGCRESPIQPSVYLVRVTETAGNVHVSTQLGRGPTLPRPRRVRSTCIRVGRLSRDSLFSGERPKRSGNSRRRILERTTLRQLQSTRLHSCRDWGLWDCRRTRSTWRICGLPRLGLLRPETIRQS